VGPESYSGRVEIRAFKSQSKLPADGASIYPVSRAVALAATVVGVKALADLKGALVDLKGRLP
jgi:hypothetical protein